MTPENPPIKEQNTPRIPQTFQQAALDFEISKINELKFSRKTAWVIAIIASGIAAVSILVVLVALLKRPEPEPIILEVDKITGASKMMRSIKDNQDKYDEVINKYWLATYVRAREGYDWYTIAEQLETVKLMTDDSIKPEYTRLVQASNAPLTVLQNKAKIVPKITSISFVGDLAQVRFTTEKLSVNGDNSDGSPTQKWIATIAFVFHAGLMTDQQRLVNPLGFKVISYRVDPEVIN